MTSAISGASYSMQALSTTRSGSAAPDPSKMAEKLFAKIDSNQDGSIDKTELTSFIQAAQSKSDSGSSGVNIDSALQALDSNSDGSITQQEFTDSTDALFSALRDQMTSSRLGGSEQPPPPDSTQGANATHAGHGKHGGGLAGVFMAALQQYQTTQTSSSTASSSQLSVAA